MKKILFILSLFLVLFTFNISVKAASSITSGTADNNETVTLEVKLGESKTVKSGAISFEYDNTKISIESGEWKVTNTIVSTFDMNTEKGAFAFMNATKISGTIFKVTFRVKSGTAYGKYAVSAKLEFEDASSQKSAEIVNANITVGCSHNLSVKDPKDTNLASKATCTSPAKYYYLCSKCNQKGTKTYEYGTALGHTGGTPSCSKKAICTRCSKEYGNLLEHTFGKWNEVEKATEEKEGLKERVCSVCNKKETEKIAVLGHTHKYQEIIEFDAICSGKGLKKHICSCGDSYDEIIPAKQHSYSEYEILVNPTETTYGYKQKKCSECGYIKLEKIEKLTHEHKYSNNYYANKDGHYKECECGNKTQVEAHTFGKAVEKDGVKEYTCKVCGYTKVEVLSSEHLASQSLTIYYAIIGTEALIILLLGVLMIALKKKKK